MADHVLALDGPGRPIDVGPPAAVAARSARRMHEAGIWLPAAIEPGRVDERSSARRLVRHAPGASRKWRHRRGRPTPGSRPATSRSRTSMGGRSCTACRSPSSPANGWRSSAPTAAGSRPWPGCSSGLLRPDRGIVRLGGDDPARLRPPSSPGGPPTSSRIPSGSSWPKPSGPRSCSDSTPRAGCPPRPCWHDLDLPLERFGGRSPFRLSGGEARRLSLAIALVRDPAVLVLDEPTFGQDRRNYDALLDILDGHLRAGATLIAATHDGRFVADVAERVITMSDGRITADERDPMMLEPRRARAMRSSTAPSAARVRSSSSAVAVGWLIGLAFTLAWPPPLVLAGAAIVGRGSRSARSGRSPRPVHRAAVGRGAGDRAVQRALLDEQRRPGGDNAGRPGPVPADGLGGHQRPRAGTAGDGDRVGRGGVHADDGSDQAGRRPRPAGPRVAALRLRGAGRVPGDPEVCRGPVDTSPGAPDPRACAGHGIRASWSRCSSWRSGTATGWRWRWMPGRSGPAR